MKKIRINRKWSSRNRLFAPGTYDIPADMSVVEARCCELDTAGYRFSEAAEEVKPAPARRGRRKAAAPENKLAGPAPEDKAEMDGPAGDSGGDGAVSDEGSC
jgi:hypothetical protein